VPLVGRPRCGAPPDGAVGVGAVVAGAVDAPGAVCEQNGALPGLGGGGVSAVGPVEEGHQERQD
jgi:hypothetical protein